MKSKLLACIMVLVLSACAEDEYRTVKEVRSVCDGQSKVVRAEFILQCIKNANPKSDEEPEDWIHLCQEMAEDTFCALKTLEIKQFKPANSYWRDSAIIEKKLTDGT